MRATEGFPLEEKERLQPTGCKQKWYLKWACLCLDCTASNKDVHDYI